MITTVDALQSLKPGAEWTLRGDELEWHDAVQTEPTDIEIQTEIGKLKYLEGIQQYRQDRVYPAMGEQLDNIFHNGVDAWKVDIQVVKDAHPKVLPVQADQDAYVTTHIDTYTFNKQLAEYKIAVARLAQYVLSVGREEVTEMKSTGEQVFNDDTKAWEDVQEEVVVVSAIDPLDATVEQTVYSDDVPAVATIETVANPLIVTDVAERAEAQTVVDNTPQLVKDSI